MDEIINQTQRQIADKYIPAMLGYPTVNDNETVLVFKIIEVRI